MAYYLGNGSGSSALDPQIKRDLLELNLIEEYGWTPEYISKLPYKWIQKHQLMKRMKGEAIEMKTQKQQFMQKAHGPKPGQRMMREV